MTTCQRDKGSQFGEVICDLIVKAHRTSATEHGFGKSFETRAASTCTPGPAPGRVVILEFFIESCLDSGTVGYYLAYSTVRGLAEREEGGRRSTRRQDSRP